MKTAPAERLLMMLEGGGPWTKAADDYPNPPAARKHLKALYDQVQGDPSAFARMEAGYRQAMREQFGSRSMPLSPYEQIMEMAKPSVPTIEMERGVGMEPATFLSEWRRRNGGYHTPDLAEI